MSKDPIVEEVRAIRAKITAEHGNDLGAIIGTREPTGGADGRCVVNLAAKRVPREQTRKAG